MLVLDYIKLSICFPLWISMFLTHWYVREPKFLYVFFTTKWSNTGARCRDVMLFCPRRCFKTHWNTALSSLIKHLFGQGPDWERPEALFYLNYSVVLASYQACLVHTTMAVKERLIFAGKLYFWSLLLVTAAVDAPNFLLGRSWIVIASLAMRLLSRCYC